MEGTQLFLALIDTRAEMGSLRDIPNLRSTQHVPDTAIHRPACAMTPPANLLLLFVVVAAARGDSLIAAAGLRSPTATRRVSRDIHCLLMNPERIARQRKMSWSWQFHVSPGGSIDTRASPPSTDTVASNEELPSNRVLGLTPAKQALALGVVLLAAALATGAGLGSSMSGLVAGAMIAPLAYAFDAATMQNASGKRRLEHALAHFARQAVTDIRRFCGPEFYLQLLTLMGTFGLANLLTACGVTGVAKLIPLTLVASTLSIHKDMSLALASGQRAPAPFPLASKVLFLGRDLINIAAVFLLPPALTPRLQSLLRLGPAAAIVAAQFLCPFLAQLLQTFVHLLGLTFYNRPDATPAERVREVRSQFAKAYAARVSRTAVVYSAGGTLNRALLAWAAYFSARTAS